MQTHGSTNKSPIKLYAAEIKFDTVICLRMEKTYMAKTSPSDFKVIPENLLLLKQAVTSKGITIPYTNI